MRVKTGIGWPHEVRKDQLEITTYKGSGPGGQNRNKRETAVRMKHLPTGVVTQAEEHRTQEQNKKAAFGRLAELLVPIMKKEHRKERYAAGTERIRSYAQKEDRVKDERVERIFSYKDVLSGNMDELIQELMKRKERGGR